MKTVKMAVALTFVGLLVILIKLALEVQNIESRYQSKIMGIGVIAAKADSSMRQEGREASFNQDALVMAIGEVVASIPQENRAKFAGESVGIQNSLAYIEQKAHELRARHYPQVSAQADGVAPIVVNPSPEAPAPR